MVHNTDIDNRIEIFSLLKNHKSEELIENYSNEILTNPNMIDENGNSLIQIAVLMNNIPIVSYLLNGNPRIQSLDSLGYSILFFPIKFRYNELLKLLIDSKGSMIIDIVDKDGNTPVIYAIKSHNYYALKLLGKAGCNFEYTSPTTGNSYIHFCIEERDLASLEIIINFLDEKINNVENEKNNVDVKNGLNETTISKNLRFIINKRNSQWNTPLLLASMVVPDNFEIIKFLVQKGSYINKSNFNGEISAHYFALSGSFTSFLAINGIFSQTFPFEILLSICNDYLESLQTNTLLNLNKEQSKIIKLITHNTTTLNINIQEAINGNTALHISLLRNWEKITYFIFTKYFIIPLISETFPLLDIHCQNGKGVTIFHIILTSISMNFDNSLITLFLLLIPHVNLNIQDNNGNTSLHLFFLYNIFEFLMNNNYILDILKTKKLNIFIKNFDGETAYDLAIKNLSSDQLEIFLNIVSESILNTLTLPKYKGSWLLKWQNDCSLINESNKQNNEQNNEQNKKRIKCLKKCRKMIDKENISVPLKKDRLDIEIFKFEDDKSNLMNPFTGNTIDVFSGFIYLYEKHSLKCNGLMKIILNPEKIINKEEVKYSGVLGYFPDILKSTQMSIHWLCQRIFFSGGFDSYFRKLFSNNVRFIVAYIGINLVNNINDSSGGHAGCVIYDKETNTVERFEPNGESILPGFYYNPDLLDASLKSKFHSLLNGMYVKWEQRVKKEYHERTKGENNKTKEGNERTKGEQNNKNEIELEREGETKVNLSKTMKYLKPSDYMKFMGLQRFDAYESDILKNKHIGDNEGYCILWIIFYLDYKLKYPSIPSKKLLTKIIKKINRGLVPTTNTKKDRIGFLDIIRSYRKVVTTIRDDLIKQINPNLTINDYVNGKFTDEQLNKLVSLIIEKLQ